jgi:geranylgeranyl pyrophosphate synthase
VAWPAFPPVASPSFDEQPASPGAIPGAYLPLGASGLRLFEEQVNARVLRAIRDPDADPSQRQLLDETVARLFAQAGHGSFSNPTGLLYLTRRAWAGEPDEQAVHVAAFGFLYIASLDLFDDVQDDDLAGKPHEHAGPAIATNSALALLFAALACLRDAEACETRSERRLRFLDLFVRVSRIAVAAQHQDLLGEAGASTPEQVLWMARGKTSSIAMVLECGALLASCDDAMVEVYRRVGESVTCLAQIVDDLRDIYGKSESPDLATGKMTYPLACFLERANDQQSLNFRELSQRLPVSLHEIRELFHATGAVEACATALERLRLEVHEEIAKTENTHAAHRLLLDVVDGLVSTVYEPERPRTTEHLWQPNGEFHDSVRGAQASFLENMRPYQVPDAPRLEPWHLPHFMYDPAREVIYYPDVDGLPEEILSFQARLLATDEKEVRRVMHRQLPAVISHEMFHFWRHRAGRLTEDAWHEEYAANRLAVGYTRRFWPQLLEGTLELADRVLEQSPGALSPRALELLERSRQPSPTPRGYELDIEGVAVLHMLMLKQLAAEHPRLESDIPAFLEAQ